MAMLASRPAQRAARDDLFARLGIVAGHAVAVLPQVFDVGASPASATSASRTMRRRRRPAISDTSGSQLKSPVGLR
jgi:hypothetical protein